MLGTYEAEMDPYLQEKVLFIVTLTELDREASTWINVVDQQDYRVQDTKTENWTEIKLIFSFIVKEHKTTF